MHVVGLFAGRSRPFRAEAVSTPCGSAKGTLRSEAWMSTLALGWAATSASVISRTSGSPGSLAPGVPKGYFGCCVDRGITQVSYE
jgi:hypothetical protein